MIDGTSTRYPDSASRLNGKVDLRVKRRDFAAQGVSGEPVFRVRESEGRVEVWLPGDARE